MSSRKAKAVNKPHVEKRAAPSSKPPAAPPVPPAPAAGAGATETAPVVAAQRQPRKFGRQKDVRDMNRAELETYAIELGMLKRCLELTDDRLRQNIRAFIDEMFE